VLLGNEGKRGSKIKKRGGQREVQTWGKEVQEKLHRSDRKKREKKKKREGPEKKKALDLLPRGGRGKEKREGKDHSLISLNGRTARRNKPAPREKRETNRRENKKVDQKG